MFAITDTGRFGNFEVDDWHDGQPIVCEIRHRGRRHTIRFMHTELRDIEAAVRSIRRRLESEAVYNNNRRLRYEVGPDESKGCDVCANARTCVCTNRFHCTGFKGTETDPNAPDMAQQEGA